MQDLIAQVRQTIDFDMAISKLCNGPCTGCSKKLLEFLGTEIDDWEYRLSRGESPSLGDIRTMAKRSKKIYAALKKNGLVDSQRSNIIASS